MLSRKAAARPIRHVLLFGITWELQPVRPVPRSWAIGALTLNRPLMEERCTSNACAPGMLFPGARVVVRRSPMGDAECQRIGFPPLTHSALRRLVLANLRRAISHGHVRSLRHDPEACALLLIPRGAYVGVTLAVRIGARCVETVAEPASACSAAADSHLLSVKPSFDAASRILWASERGNRNGIASVGSSLGGRPRFFSCAIPLR